MEDTTCIPEPYRLPAWAGSTVPNRPWWGGHSLNLGSYQCTRRDGAVVAVPTKDRAKAAKPPQTLIDACIIYDLKNPITTPPIRVGQIWVALDGPRTVVIGPVTDLCILESEDVGVFDIIESMYKRWIRNMSKNLRELELVGKGSGIVTNVAPNIRGVALIYDPIRPDQTPWTGTP